MSGNQISGKLQAPLVKLRQLDASLVKKPDKEPDLGVEPTEEVEEVEDACVAEDAEDDAVERHDVTVRHWENTFHIFRTIKMKLNTFLRTNTQDSKNLSEVISESVATVNHGVYLIYQFMNFHILRLLAQNEPSILPKQITNQLIQLAYIVVTNVDDKFVPSKKLKANEYLYGSALLFRQHLNESFPTGQYPFPSRNYRFLLYNLASSSIADAIENHLSLNIEKRLAKYLKITKTDSNGAKGHYLAQRILNIIQPNPDWITAFDGDEASETLIKQFKKDLKINGTDPVKVTTQLRRYLPLYQKFLLCFEENEEKLFSILPQKGEFGDSCIKIDSSALSGLITLATGEQGVRTKILLDHRSWWNKYFRLNKVETAKFRFANEITTNGYEVNIVIKQHTKPFPTDYNTEWTLKEKATYIVALREQEKKAREEAKVNKPKRVKKTPEELEAEAELENPFAELEWNEYLTVLGLDTGGRNLLNHYDPVTHKRIRITGKEWRCRTGQTEHVAWNNRRKDKFFAEGGLNQLSFKTGDYEKFCRNLRLIVPKLASLFKFYGSGCNKKKKFTKYGKTQKMYNVVRNRFDLHKDINQLTVIGFGDGAVNTNGCIKGPKGPNKKLYEALQKSPTIFCRKARERYSSKRCNQCHHDTVNVYKWKDIEDNAGNVIRRVKARIYGLRRCSSNDCGITWDRDNNASPNIRAVVVAQIKKEARPAYLTKAGALSNPRIEALKKKNPKIKPK